MNIKKGDNVLVIAGKDKGKSGKVLETSPKANKITVENVNIVTKHQKPKSQQDKGGIIKKTAPIEASNVMIICPNCGKATRVSHKQIEGKNVRACKKCGASLDKEFAKTVKKEAKKAEKIAQKAENKQVAQEKAPETKAKTKTTKTAPKAEEVKATKPAAKNTNAKPATKAAAKTTTTATKPATKSAATKTTATKSAANKTATTKTAPKKSKTTEGSK